jgi:hypothetical protein
MAQIDTTADKRCRGRAGCGCNRRAAWIALDIDEAAGMLLGMVASAPQRAAVFGRLPLPSCSQIEARVRSCAALFLRGCRLSRRSIDHADRVRVWTTVMRR